MELTTSGSWIPAHSTVDVLCAPDNASEQWEAGSALHDQSTLKVDRIRTFRSPIVIHQPPLGVGFNNATALGALRIAIRTDIQCYTSLFCLVYACDFNELIIARNAVQARTIPQCHDRWMRLV